MGCIVVPPERGAIAFSGKPSLIPAKHAPFELVCGCWQVFALRVRGEYRAKEASREPARCEGQTASRHTTPRGSFLPERSGTQSSAVSAWAARLAPR